MSRYEADLEKSRMNLCIPSELYKMIHSDSVKYGISKSAIVSVLLYAFYSGGGSVEGLKNECRTD